MNERDVGRGGFFRDADWPPETEELDDIVPPRRRVHTFAVLSLICGVLSLGCFLLGFPAVILGVWARGEIRKYPHAMRGGGLATAGIVLGCVFTVVNILLSVNGYQDAAARARYDQAQRDMRWTALNLESYRIYHKHLPTAREYYKSGLRPGTALPAGMATTPFSGNSYAAPYRAPDDAYHYGYATLGEKDKGIWVLRSWGPDGDADLDLDAVLQTVQANDPAQWERLERECFDPSNGMKSDGDIIKTGP